LKRIAGIAPENNFHHTSTADPEIYPEINPEIYSG
jgi:hypothetical protein